MKQRRLERDLDYANQCCKIVEDYLVETHPNGIEETESFAFTKLYFEIDNCVKNPKKIENIEAKGDGKVFWFIYNLDKGMGKLVIRGVIHGGVYTFGYDVSWNSCLMTQLERRHDPDYRRI